MVLKKVVSSNGYWSSSTGPNVDGFSMAGSDYGISRSDLEAAAQAGPNTSAWNKVIFGGADFTPLTLSAFFNICREQRPTPWDPVTVTSFPPTPTPGPTATPGPTPPPTPPPTYGL